MRKIRWLMLVPIAALAVACGRNSSPAADDALKTDLALASQAQAPGSLTVSPTEQGLAATPAPQYAPRPVQAARRPVYSAPVRRRSTSSASRSSAGSSGGYYPAPAPAPAPVTVKHTQRDAAIGAAAGAVIGATSSRNKVRGGLIGAAVGGILGGVLGNNVDVQKKPGGF